MRLWTIIGLVAQGLFFGRFFIQWLASERKGESTVPVAFWFFSMFGGALLLIYAIHQRDIVFISGQAGGLVIYLRNLMLIYKKNASEIMPRQSVMANNEGAGVRHVESV